MENLQITLQLPLQWVNLVLASLAKQPLEVVNDAWSTIKTQAQSQVDAANKPAVTVPPPPVEPPPPASQATVVEQPADAPEAV